MKKFVGLAFVLMLLSTTGCATKEYVRSQVDPLAERLSKLEDKVSQLGGMTDADKAAIQQANGKAQQALDVANKAEAGVKKADDDAAQAAASATRAENAANTAEQAAREAQQQAKKTEKIFKLEQKK